MKELILAENIKQKIFLIRGQKVMLSSHLAELYGVEVRALVQALKRNIERFPEDFMFRLTWEEVNSLKGETPRSQNVTLKKGYNIKYLPYAFTEQGVAMLSSILRSKHAIQVNIAIMRTFVTLKRTIGNNKELAKRLCQLEEKIEKHDEQIYAIFEAIRQLTELPETPKPRIGFHDR